MQVTEHENHAATLYFCVTSTRTGIGDGFLELINGGLAHPERAVVVHGPGYESREFAISGELIYSLPFDKARPFTFLSPAGWHGFRRFCKLRQVGGIVCYSTSPINWIAAILSGAAPEPC